jgi:hypothetical protein
MRINYDTSSALRNHVFYSAIVRKIILGIQGTRLHPDGLLAFHEEYENAVLATLFLFAYCCTIL